MFQFGILSSFIPYILVAVLSLLSMTSYAKHILFGDIEENNSEEILSIASEDSMSSDSSENISFYTNLYEQFNKTTLSWLNTNEEDTIIRFYKNDSINESLFYSYRFCRPPPAL